MAVSLSRQQAHAPRVQASNAVAGEPSSRRSVAVVGAGWAGLAAAVGLTQSGLSVTILEMAPVPGGRARTVGDDAAHGDNGQHIMIGAYRSTLWLLKQVGVQPDEVLLRTPLALQDTQGQGLRLREGPAAWEFTRAVLAWRQWPLAARLTLLRRCAVWAASGFRCEPALTVQELCAGLPPALSVELLEPLCVAALNTPAHEASAEVFLRVIRDALLGGRGCADLLLPRVPLGSLFPEAAQRWLESRGSRLLCRTRARSLDRHGAGWAVDGQAFDAVVLACTASEAARLAQPHVPAWATLAQGLRHQSILTSYVHCAGARFDHHPMARLDDGPAQFAFDHGWLSESPGVFAFVASAADAWMTEGLRAAESAVLTQARSLLRTCGALDSPRILRSVCERKATFACAAGLQRPPAQVAPGLWAAADYVAGPYPATLETAVRSGLAAAHAIVESDCDVH